MARKITLTTETVRKSIQADNAARKEKAAAKRAATLKAKKDAIEQSRLVAEAALQSVMAKRQAARDLNAERAAYLNTLREDYDATMAPAPAINHPEAFNAWLAEQGVAPDGSPLQTEDVQAKPEAKAHYTGPMLALRTAQVRYVKAANGILCNGDELATALGALTREQVVTVLIKAMKLESNPYLHLNPGQQSMNLRNKARGQIKAGFLKVSDVVATIERESRHPA